MNHAEMQTDMLLTVSETGKEYWIRETQHYECVVLDDVAFPKFPEDYIPTIKSYATTDGKLCNILSQEEFLVFDGIEEIKTKVRRP